MLCVGRERGVKICKFSRGIRVGERGDDFKNTLNGSRKGLVLVVRMGENLLKKREQENE